MADWIQRAVPALLLAVLAALLGGACETTGVIGDDDEYQPCGDGLCEMEGESCDTCPADCGECPVCGDAVCALESGWESCDSCPHDCGTCGACGDGECSLVASEDCATCQEDCGACPGCGDGVCDVGGGETCASCTLDCGDCNPCGDGTCDAAGGETCMTCADDCGPCDPCGDGECDPDEEDCATCTVDCGICAGRSGCIKGTFTPRWGNLHSHTHFSDGGQDVPPGEATPAKAFQHARGAGLDFMWVTDHREALNANKWNLCKQQAQAHNVPGTFVAGCGYEMTIWNTAKTAKIGHLNALFTGQLRDKPYGLSALYNWLVACDPCVGQWNHPPGPGTFGDYKFYDVGRSAMRLMELSGGAPFSEKWNAFFTALGKGWLVSPSQNEDNHKANWGDFQRATGIWVTSLSRYGIRKAVRGRRTFATGDDTAWVKMTADDGCWMGSVLRGAGPTLITVEAKDKDPADGFAKIELYGPNKTIVASHACAGANPCKAQFPFEITAKTFFVAKVVQQDGGRLVSAPLWYVP